MKRLVVALPILVLSACTNIPAPVVDPHKVQPVEEAKPELVTNEVLNSDTTEAIATDFGLIFIDRDMTFTGTLPCKKCAGIQYQLNIFADGRFEARREYLDKNQVELLSGTWQLDDRTLHLTPKQGKMPSFHFGSSNVLVQQDVAGKPIVTKENYSLTRQQNFSRIDTRMPLLGVYKVQNNEAVFTDCATGENLSIAMTQHHMPMMRNYQADPKIAGKPVVATLTARKGEDNPTALFVDRFDQFWPGATCPDKAATAKVQNVVWRLTAVSSIGVPQKLNIRLMFDENKRVFGFAGCNNFNANYEQKDNRLSVKPVMMTRKSCADGNFYEQQFTKQLQVADRIEVNQQKLQLFKDNKVVMELVPASN